MPCIDYELLSLGQTFYPVMKVMSASICTLLDGATVHEIFRITLYITLCYEHP